MLNLQDISSVAPSSDIGLGLIIILIAVAAANLTIIPKLFSQYALLAKALLVVTVLGCTTSVITLAIQPHQFYFITGIYMVTFMLSGFVLAWRSIDWRQPALRVLLGSIGMLLAWTIAYWITYVPR